MKAIKLLGASIIVCLVGFSVGWRFAKPELTETQLFLSLWWTYPILIAGLILYFVGREFDDVQSE